jgi:hypothetical protein
MDVILTFHVTTILMKHFTCYLLTYAYVVPSVKETWFREAVFAS